MKTSTLRGLALSVMVVIADAACVFGQNGSLSGTIRGSENASLPSATVLIVGTTNGTVADLNGNYFLGDIAAGSHKISFSYVGYQTKTVVVVIKPGLTTKLDVTLHPAEIMGKEVVVTAQKMGQEAAINQQVNSNSIVNVVAADRLQQNPDANAAEAIGRLPGISLIRSGGQGTGIVIRGMDPKYTKVLVEGISLPSTNDNTSAVDISGLSEYALQGVEVFKSVTPDMDANATAGAVNLELAEAPRGFKYNLMAQGGYNSLNSYYRNYKLVGSVSNRFLQDKLGLILNADVERENTSDQTLGASYETKTVPPPGQFPPLYASSINLNDITRFNDKSSGTLVADYEPSSKTKLSLFNFFSYNDVPYQEVTKSYLADNGSINYEITNVPNDYSESFLTSLTVKHEFNSFELDGGVAFAQSHEYTPDSRNWVFDSFGTTSLGLYGTDSAQSLPLSQILASATDTLSTQTLNNFNLWTLGRTADNLRDSHLTAYANFKLPLNIGTSISGYVKFGAKYRDDSRNRNYDDRTTLVLAALPNVGVFAQDSLPWVGISSNYGRDITLAGLYGYMVNNFLKSNYNFGWYPSMNRLNQIFDWWNNFSNYYLNVNPKAMPPNFQPATLGFEPQWLPIDWNMQKLSGYYYAGYVMGELDLGNELSLIPGVRYERVRDNLSGWWVQSLPYTIGAVPGFPIDSTHNDEYLLPNIHLKIKPTSWLQSLLSFTQTLQRPDYDMLMPNVNLSTNAATGEFYQSGNPDLKPELWTNYDLQIAAFGNEIGLVSVDGFYKVVKDMIWIPSIYHVAGEAWPLGTAISQYFSPNSTVLITVPQNNPFPAHLQGLEAEVQTGLWFLPKPLSYITLDANFTLLSATTEYQYSKTFEEQVGTDSRGVPIYKLVTVDSTYQGPMLNQPKSIVNFSFGYNYKGFNLWLSYQYTGAMVSSFPNLPWFETDVSQFVLWDLQISQKLPVNGLELLFNYANINNPILSQNNLGDVRPTYQESYGWNAYFGLRYTL